MIHVVIESSVLKSQPSFTTKTLDTMSILARSGTIRIWIPHFVEQEYTTWLVAKQIDVSEKLGAALRKQLRLLPKGRARDVAEELRTFLEERIRGIPQQVQSEFDEWLAQSGARRLPLQPSHSARVSDAYFEGKAPFRAAKERADFPDAFIWCSIEDITNEVGNSIVLVADKRLADLCEADERITVFQSFPEFLRWDPIQSALKPHNADYNFRVLQSLLRSLTPTIVSKLEQEIPYSDEDSSFYERVKTAQVADSYIPNQSWEVSIIFWEELKSFRSSPEQAAFLGGGTIAVPFEADIIARLHYFNESISRSAAAQSCDFGEDFG